MYFTRTVFRGKFQPCLEDGWSPIQGHVLIMVQKPNVYLQHSGSSSCSILIKLSGENQVYRGKLQVLRFIHFLLPLHT